jgi:hypothetical protein
MFYDYPGVFIYTLLAVPRDMQSYLGVSIFETSFRSHLMNPKLE